MIRRLFAIALPVLLVLTLIPMRPSAAEDSAPYQFGAYKIDPVHSSVIFGISHLGITYVYGRFNTLSGVLTLKENANAIDMTVEAASIDTNNEKRDKHLRSEDFFNVETHPVISFKSKRFTPTGSGMYEVEGDLTLHGVTRPVTVEAKHIGSGEDPWGGYRTGFQTTFQIKRSDYGMDKLMNSVGDDVELTVAIEAIRE
jgi:polyisoprenoid-binding protein YceI